MSKLDDLINNLCPNGVEYISLENCCDYVDYRGKTPKKTDRGIFLVTAKNIRQGYIDYESSKEYVSPDDYEEIMHRGLPEIGDVLFTTEAPCGFVAQIDNDKVALAQRVIKYRGHKGILNNSFLKYVLLGEEFQTKLHKISTGSTVEGIKGSRLHKMEIPVPPLEVQNEVVRILDKFTSLEAELEAELEARRKQYEYYRDSLLTFGDDVEWKALGEIATDIYRGSGIKRDQVTTEGIPCVRYGEIYTSYNIHFNNCISHTIIDNVPSPKYFEHGDILFAITGESVEDIAKSIAYMGNEKCLAGGDIVVLKHNQNPKYLSFALSTNNAIMQKGKGKVKSKVVHSSVPSISEIKIPIPDLETQEKIANILDNFLQLTNNITSGLPAEIEARHKQYEYYRDKLLTFKRREG